MRSTVPFEDAWHVLLPLVAKERVDPVLVRAALDSLDVREGPCERLVRTDLVSVIIQATVPSNAMILVFVGAIPLMRLEVEADAVGWYVKRLAVRSSFYRLLLPTCHRLRLDLVADPALHALGHQWVT